MLEAKAKIAGDLTPEMSVVMPCLNEAQTVGTCIRKALAYLEMYNVQGEVIVAGNGSSDGSQAPAWCRSLREDTETPSARPSKKRAAGS